MRIFASPTSFRLADMLARLLLPFPARSMSGKANSAATDAAGNCRRSGVERRSPGGKLQVRLALIGAAITFASVGTVSAVVVYRHASALRDEIDRAAATQRQAAIEHGQSLARTATALIEPSLLRQDIASIKETIVELRRAHPNIAYIRVTDPSDQIVAETSGGLPSRGALAAVAVGESRPTTPARGVMEIVEPLDSAGLPWGYLQVGLDLRALDAQAAAARRRGADAWLETAWMIAGVAVLVAFLCVLASVVFQRRILAPLHRLADDVARLADGDLDHAVATTNRDDEIAFLARQFERMRESIKTYIGALVVAKERAEAATRSEKRLRAQLEEHMRLLEVKVEERTAELRRMNAKLTEYDRMKSEFLSNVSHELRSPLAAIASAAKIIARFGDVDRPNGKRFSAVIQDEAERLRRLIDDLLDLAKIESGKIEWHREVIDAPGKLLSYVAETYQPLAAERGIRIEIEANDALPALTADRDRIIQVLSNLVSNAVKFTPQNGRIVLRAQSTAHNGVAGIRFEVEDSGPGIPAEEREKIFDRFHQAHARRNGSKQKGTGLGLAICREVVAHHGGEIWVEPGVDGGARFVFTLPTCLPQAIESATEATEQHP